MRGGNTDSLTVVGKFLITASSAGLLQDMRRISFDAIESCNSAKGCFETKTASITPFLSAKSSSFFIMNIGTTDIPWVPRAVCSHGSCASIDSKLIFVSAGSSCSL